MIDIKNKVDCHGCHACKNICPKNCIEMVCDEKGFWYPVIDRKKCINCNLCEKVCSIIHLPNKKELNLAYACKSKNDKNRFESSSGGVFIELCKYVLSNNGVVFGAKYDENLNVVHGWADTLESCIKFKKSKYVQSKIGETYKISKKFLDEGRMVIFTGTPCQIAGLDSYLMKKYDNLILVDIACHGVPSPLVYKKYIKCIENKTSNVIKSIDFREKSTGWINYNIKINLRNSNLLEKASENLYMKGFLQDLYLRDSCYECKFKKPITAADITLADYWGIEKLHPNFCDDEGVSLVLLNTEKGNNIFKKILENITYIKSDYNEATIYNPSIIKGANYNKKTGRFFVEINKENVNVEKVINKYTKVSLLREIKRGFVKKLKGR